MANIILKSQRNTIPTTNLGLWLRADKGVVLNGTTVSQWNDQSGNGNNAIQGTANAQPLYVENVLNGLPTLRFDGGNDLMNITTNLMNGISAYTCFSVIKYTYNTNNTLISGNLAGGNSESFLNYAYIFAANTLYGNLTLRNGMGYIENDCYTNFNVLSQNFNGNGTGNSGKLKIYKNGTNLSLTYLGTVPSTTLANTSLLIGREVPNNNWMNGDIAEIIFYNSALSDYNRQQVEKYLSSKYNISVAAQTFQFPSSIFRSKPQIPRTNMVLWLKADYGVVLNGTTVSQWNDISGNGNNATQATSSSQP